MSGTEFEEEDDLPALFPFRPDEELLVDQFSAHLRSQLYGMSAYEIRNISTFLCALERLPYATPDISISLACEVREGRELVYMDASICEGYFRLSTGGHVYDPGVGGDSFSECVFEVEAGGFRSGDAFSFQCWIDGFVNFSGEWSFDNAGDDDVDYDACVPDDGWSRLK